MATIKLSDIKAAADKKYSPTVIDLEDGTSVELVHPIRLGKKKRDNIAKMKENLTAEGADEAAVVGKILLDAAQSPTQGKKLVASAEGDFGVLMQILDFWFEGTDAGEASPSES